MNRRHCIGALLGMGALVSSDLVAAQSVRKAWPARKPTPPLELPAVDTAPWRLAGERGHAVLLNFWASWCEPCRAEMPALERLALSQREAGLRVVAVNYREGEPAVKRFLAKMPLQLPVVRDADGAAARAFGINIFPSTVAIDRQGRVRFIIVGEFDWDGGAGMEAIRPLL
ncbi:TlpA family protein disulfide reductase [Ramlibacter sp. PS4R-6]|uniref:TlpA family protein disulfide reductase n=1 Tax=Ramlibacter sp. PS4R-6 TaxID=3133438 RepID=UPI0030B0D8A8